MERGPPLSEEFEPGWVGDVGGGVGDGMAGVELGGGERAEGARSVGLRDRVESHVFSTGELVYNSYI